MAGEIHYNWNEQLFREQYRKYYRALVVYVLKMVSAQTQAEDVVQDVFLNLWRKKSLIEDETKLRSYLYASVRNRALDYLKHKHVEQEYIDKVKENVAVFSLNENEEEFLFTDEIFRRLFQHVEALPPRQRDLFLKLIEGKRLREIANEMNVSIETVKTQKARGLNTLRKQMNPETLVLLISLIG